MLEFEPYQARHLQRAKQYLALRPVENCEGQLPCGYMWGIYYKSQIAFDDIAVYLIEEYHGTTCAWIPWCRLGNMKEAVLRLLSYYETVKKEPMNIYGVDEEAANELDEDFREQHGLLLEELQDSADYIYDAEKMRSLSGKKLHKKKNHLNAFLKNYEGRYEYRRLFPEQREEILSFFEYWNQLKPREDEEHTLYYEMEGLKRILSDFALLDVKMGGIYIDGRLSAFALGSYNEALQIAYVHMEKAIADIRGLYPMINREFLVQEYPEAKLVNREDDMGMEHLRRAKQSYYPLKMGRKFRLYQK